MYSFYKFSLIILLILLFNGCSKQIIKYHNTFIQLYPYQVNGLWGYYNVESGDIIKPEFEEADFFYGELAVVKSGGKFSFINKFGDKVLKNKFDKVSTCSGNGFARVERNGKKFCINKKGKKVKCGVDNLYGCYEPKEYEIKEYYKVLENELGKKAIYYLDYDTLSGYEFDTIIPISYEFAIVGKSEKYGFYRIDMPSRSSKIYNGKLLHGYETKYIYDEIVVDNSKSGRFKISNQFAKIRIGNNWGIINLNSLIEIINPKYISVKIIDNILNSTLFLVEYQKGNWGYVNYEGKELFPRD